MNEIFKVFGSVFLKGAEDTEDQLNDIDDSAEKTGKSFDGFGKKVGKAAKVVGAGILAAGGAMAGLAKKTADATDRVDKMSQRLGLSRQGFQEWEFVLSQSGVDIDSLQSGMKTLSQRMQEANDGAGMGAELFKKLGVTITDSMTQEEAFNATVEALQGMEDGTEKAALAQQLLGRSGQELLPLLNSTAEATDALKQEANDLGLVMGDDAIDAGVKFTDTMDKLKRSFGAAFAAVGAQLLPVFEKMASWIVDNMPMIQEFFGKAFEVIGKAIKVVADFIMDPLIPIFQVMFNWVKDNLPTIKAVFKTVFDVIAEVIGVVWDVIEALFLPILKTVFTWVKDNWSTISDVFSFVFDIVKEVVQIAIDIVQDLWDVFVNIFNFVKDVFFGIGDLIKGAFDGVVGFIDTVIGVFNDVVGAISDTIDKVKEFFGLANEGAEVQLTAQEAFQIEAAQAEYTGPSVTQTGGYGVRPSDLPGSQNNYNNNITIENMNVRSEEDIQSVSRGLYDLQRETERGYGTP